MQVSCYLSGHIRISMSLERGWNKRVEMVGRWPVAKNIPAWLSELKGMLDEMKMERRKIKYSLGPTNSSAIFGCSSRPNLVHREWDKKLDDILPDCFFFFQRFFHPSGHEKTKESQQAHNANLALIDCVLFPTESKDYASHKYAISSQTYQNLYIFCLFVICSGPMWWLYRSIARQFSNLFNLQD